MLKRVVVYCGSSAGNQPEFVNAAYRFGTLLAQQGICLFFGGGSSGIMGAVADGVIAHGGYITGVVPDCLNLPGIIHQGLGNLVNVASMHDRKMLMATSADAAFALPGGIGTLEELFEFWTWLQLGIHSKPCGLLNTCGYFDYMFKFLDHVTACGFMRKEHRDLLIVESDPDRLIEKVMLWSPASSSA